MENGLVKHHIVEFPAPFPSIKFYEWLVSFSEKKEEMIMILEGSES